MTCTRWRALARCRGWTDARIRRMTRYHRRDYYGYGRGSPWYSTGQHMHDHMLDREAPW